MDEIWIKYEDALIELVQGFKNLRYLKQGRVNLIKVNRQNFDAGKLRGVPTKVLSKNRSINNAEINVFSYDDVGVNKKLSKNVLKAGNEGSENLTRSKKQKVIFIKYVKRELRLF